MRGHGWSFGPWSLLPLAGFAVTLGLGLFLWSRRREAALPRSFAAVNIAAALWNLDVFLLFTVRDGALAAALDQLFQLPVLALPFLALRFFFSFLDRPRTHPLVVGFGAWTLVLWAANAGGLLIAGWDRYWFGWWGRAGALFPLFLATLVVYLAVSTRLLWAEARRARDPQRRAQAAWLLAANLVLNVVGLTNVLPLYGIALIPLGSLVSVLYVGAIAFTIRRHRLLDGAAVLRAGMLYSLLTFCLSALYWVGVLGLQRWAQDAVFADSILLPMVPALAVAFAVSPLKASLQERLDRTFFRSRAELRDRLARFAAAVGEKEREEEVWEAAWRSGWERLRPERGAVLVGREGGLAVLRAHGLPPPDPEAAGRLLARLREPRRLDRADAPPGIEVAVPVHGRDGLLGGALLGAKVTGEAYGAEDLAFLAAISHATAMAVERLRLRERIAREQRLAALGRAAAVLSHELRNPLSIIRGAMAVLRTQGPAESAAPVIGAVEEEVARGERFIRDVLSACREPVMHRVEIDLALVLAEFARAWPSGEHGGTPLSLAAPAEGLRLHGDAFALRQVFENLARNAAEADGGGVRVQIRAWRTPEGTLMVEFADDGPGIAEDLLPALFEPFRTTKRGGTGLGLSIARGIVEAHGGRIAAANLPRGGARFRITLPATDGAGRAPGRDGEDAGGGTGAAGGGDGAERTGAGRRPGGA